MLSTVTVRLASYADRRRMAQALRPIYTAPTEEAAKPALEDFRAEWQAKSPGRSRSATDPGDKADGLEGLDPALRDGDTELRDNVAATLWLM